MYHPNYHIIQPKQHNYTYRTSTSKVCRPASASRLSVNKPPGHPSGTRLRHVQETCLGDGLRYSWAVCSTARKANVIAGDSVPPGPGSPRPKTEAVQLPVA